MAQPRDFGYTEEAAMLKQAARRLLQEKIPTQQLHKLVADEYAAEREPRAKWSQALWQDMVQLGWAGVILPEACGGSALPLVAAAGLVEEAGYAALPSPLLSTLQAACLLKACAAVHASSVVHASSSMQLLAQGTCFTLALYDEQHRWDDMHSSVRAEVTTDGFVINGVARYVQDAQKAERVLLKAQTDQGLALFALALDSKGLAQTRDHIVDLTRDQATLHFHQVRVPASALLAEGQAAQQALAMAKPALLTLLAADMVGAAEWQLQTTTEYARTRVQFDKPIGSFQAVKHPLVNAMIMIDGARALVYNAACAVEHEPDKALQYALMAKAAASDMAAFMSKKSIQLHGGIGFTWECFVHLYVKRQKQSQVLMGTSQELRRELANLLLD